MTDNNRKPLTWSVRFIENGTRDALGYIVPAGWWVTGWQEEDDDSLASIHIAEHAAGSPAAASLAAVTAHLLNGYELARAAMGEGPVVEDAVVQEEALADAEKRGAVKALRIEAMRGLEAAEAAEEREGMFKDFAAHLMKGLSQELARRADVIESGEVTL